MNKVKSMDDYIRGVLSFASQFEYAQQKHTSESMYELADYLKTLPVLEEQPTVNEWIPCSERLPEDEKTKIVTLKNGSVEGAFWSERNWWCIGDSINLEVRTEDIIAWMPLPEPYREKV